MSMVCGCLYIFMCFLNDKSKRTKFKKTKEEFNVLICSRLSITNLYVRYMPDIR